jgi:hypothetical protein
MYLIFKLHRQGYPVNEIYEQEVKPISTTRFNDELMQRGEDPSGGGASNKPPSEMLNLNSNPVLDERQRMDERGESYISFDSQASYEDLGLSRTLPKPKPDHIPGLFFGGLQGYITSDDEEEIPVNNQQQKQIQFEQ